MSTFRVRFRNRDVANVVRVRVRTEGIRRVRVRVCPEVMEEVGRGTT